jgi:hypothetical protein
MADVYAPRLSGSWGGEISSAAVAGLLMVFGELGADSPAIREALHHHARHRLDALNDIGRHVKEPARPHVEKAVERIGARLGRAVERPPA